MLVLSRKVGEQLVVGDDVTITVLEVRAGKIKIGIAAPPHVAVHRKELRDRLQRQSAPLTPAEATSPTVVECVL